jgi:hypothetical protein
MKHTNKTIAFRNMDLDAAGVLEIEVHDLIVTVLRQVLLLLMLYITNIFEQYTLVSFHIPSSGTYKTQRYENI